METTTQGKSETKRSSSKLDPKLHAVYRQLYKIVRKATISEARRRYEIGVIVLGVSGKPKTYGEKAVEKLAKRLRFDDSTLRNYASVAEIWSKEAFEKILAKRNKQGLPLRFSHLVVLAKVSDSKEREHLFELALEKGMSVRQLDAAIGRDSQQPDEPAETAHNDVTAAERRVGAAIATWEGEADQLTRKTETIAQIARTNPTPHVRELLKTCATRQRRLADAATEAADKLENLARELAN